MFFFVLNTVFSVKLLLGSGVIFIAEGMDQALQTVSLVLPVYYFFCSSLILVPLNMARTFHTVRLTNP